MYASGRSFRLYTTYTDDECNPATSTRFDTVTIPAGVTEWSMRLDSPTQMSLWDDVNEVIITSFAIPEYPRYTRVRFQGVTMDSLSGFGARTVRLYTEGDPPDYENKIDPPEGCAAHNATGYFFDTYQKAEYVNGLLRVHLRLRTPYNDGRTFQTFVFTANENCERIEPNFTVRNTQLPPHIRYYSFRMNSPTEWQLWDDESDVPISCPGCSGAIEPRSPYVYLFGRVDFGASSFSATPFPPTISIEPEIPDPVIIIPGILGSERLNGEWTIDPILHSYDDLIATLDVNHYTPNVDLFTFPYNWRKSNVETAILLKEKIDAVKAICACDKVDLVAHSMGGLVARQYIQSASYEQDVDQLIFLGTPHLGAPKAYLMWEGGKYGSGLSSFLLVQLLSHEAAEHGYTDLFSYVRTEPIEAVRELLPVYSYIFDGIQLRDYPTEYPANTVLETLNADVDYLYNSGVQIHNITGNLGTSQTITGIAVTDPSSLLPRWQHGYPSDPIFGSGDGTVPTPSASFIGIDKVLNDADHTALVAAAEGAVFKILTGNEAVDLIHNFQMPNMKILVIKILSPADLLVIAPDGKKIGKDFASGQELNEIPNAFYTGFTTNTEYITILNPLDGEYMVLNQGTGGGGQYTIETNYISEATTTEASFTGNTLPGLITILNIPVDNENPLEIEIHPSDAAAPEISIESPETKDYLRSEQLPVNIFATDSESGVHELVSLFDSTLTPNVGSIDLFFQPLGTHMILASSTDNVGNATTSARTFRIVADATSTLSDIQRAYLLGWVTKKLSDDLTKRLKACYVKKTIATSVTKTVMLTGKDGKKTTKKVQEKITRVEIVFDKNCAKAILKDLDKYRNKELNEQAYYMLKEDINWLINR